jgi:hypothetical protein
VDTGVRNTLGELTLRRTGAFEPSALTRLMGRGEARAVVGDTLGTHLNRMLTRALARRASGCARPSGVRAEIHRPAR